MDTEQPEPAQFALNFIWLNKNIAVAVDQLFDKVTILSSSLSLPICSISKSLPQRMLAALLALCLNNTFHALQRHHLQISLACPISADLLAGEEESCHRVLFLAQKRCMGGAEGCLGGEALDPRTVSDSGSSLCLTPLSALVMLCCCVGCIVLVAGFGNQEV